jgi:hypothetical protein
MTIDDAQKIAKIIGTADGGCSNCVGDLVERLSKMFPSFRWIITDEHQMEQPDWSEDPEDTHQVGFVVLVEPRSCMGADRFYIDCEFDGHSGSLLSVGLVREDGRSIHIATTAQATDEWVAQNVVPLIEQHRADMTWTVPENDVGSIIRHFIGDCTHPVIVADSPVDIGRFCRAISTSPHGGWTSAEYPLMTFEVHNVDCYPTSLPGAVQHNAWWDAMALRHKLTSAIEAKGGDPQGLRAQHESAMPQADAQDQPHD